MKSTKAYEILKSLEDVLRKLIEDDLSQITPNWWDERIPEEIRKKTESRKEKSESGGFPRGQNYPIISYIDFPDYEKIITQSDNWENVFKRIFRDEISIAGKFRDLRPIRNDISHSRDLSKKDGERLQFITQEIKGAIEYYQKKKSQKKEHSKPKVKQEFNQHIITLSVSSDRTVYPEKAVVHARAMLNDVIADTPIIFEIYDSNNDLILQKQLDPKTYDDNELKSNGIYQISFAPDEINTKVGESYFLKARHGNAVATDSWFVDRREPVVQTDKSVYMINGDMILTVIDPDSDKDSQSVEYVGDREDSKLIIKSKYGKIEGYKLRETGDSTAIFQGIIGILGIRKDGSVIKQKVDGKIIDKIQGTGIDDGFIGGSPGEEINITYKSSSGTASVVVFVSNFGTSVELDQKVYHSTDKVYITIVAPDLVSDFDKIIEIGTSSESMIRIRTSKDELVSYKLVETGPGTGIFTGEISLTESLETSSSKSQSTEFGPTNGIIACNKDDFIEISISCFGNEIVGRALIKP